MSTKVVETEDNGSSAVVRRERMGRERNSKKSSNNTNNVFFFFFFLSPPFCFSLLPSLEQNKETDVPCTDPVAYTALYHWMKHKLNF